VRAAALYDVHGNLQALEAVLADVDREGADLVVFGGDLVAGPFPAETLELARSVGGRFVLGNADILDPGWVRERLDEAELAYLGGFEEAVRLEIERLGPTLFRHGSPRSVDEIVTPLTPEPILREMLQRVDERLVVVGHTHVQFDRRVDDHRIVNAGSVGMAYEGRRGAFWAMIGPDVELRRTKYDVERAAAAIPADYPGRDDLAGWLLDPPDAREAATEFEQQAGR
jgi:predicted phosphodiesterase